MKRLACCLTLLLMISGHVLAADAVPGDSIYNLKLDLTTQAGKVEPLASRRGHPQLVTMFYTSCTMVCPMIIDTLKQTYKAIDEPGRDKLDILAVSFDPARDDVAALDKYASKRHLDPSYWTLARTNLADVRSFAAILGLQFQKRPDGDFNHSSELLLIDADGRIVTRTKVIGKLDPEFVAAANKLLAGS